MCWLFGLTKIRKSRVQVSQSDQAAQLSHETLAQTRTSGNVTCENNIAVPSSTGKDGSNSANDLLTMPSIVDYRETESTMGIARKVTKLLHAYDLWKLIVCSLDFPTGQSKSRQSDHFSHPRRRDSFKCVELGSNYFMQTSNSHSIGTFITSGGGHARIVGSIF